MDHVELGILLDFYGPLLTKRQLCIMDQTVNEDCSLSEIAEREGISRQGVRDALRKAEEQLRFYERMIRVAGRFREISDILERALGIYLPDSVRLLRGICAESGGFWRSKNGI